VHVIRLHRQIAADLPSADCQSSENAFRLRLAADMPFLVALDDVDALGWLRLGERRTDGQQRNEQGGTGAGVTRGARTEQAHIGFLRNNGDLYRVVSC